MSTVLALVASTDRAALARARQPTVQFCASVESLAREVRLERPVAVIYEAGFGLSEHPTAARDLEQAGTRLIVRLSLQSAAVGEFVSLARRFPHVGVSIRPHDDVESLLVNLNEPDDGPVGLVVGRIADVVASDALPLLVGGLALGRHRSGGSQHAYALGVHQRTLEAQHRRAALPQPRRLRIWGQAAWTVWRLERWSWQSKRVTAAAGYDRSSAMSDALRSVLGTSPKQFAADRGIAWLVAQLRAELRSQAEMRSTEFSRAHAHEQRQLSPGSSAATLG